MAGRAARKISVVIPVYNSVDWIENTLLAIHRALKPTSFDAEIIVIDDGSSDASADAARRTLNGLKIKNKVVSQANKGRYLARKSGVERAGGDYILFVDSRVYIDQGSLLFLEGELKKSRETQVWNGHVYVDKRGNPFARFWEAVSHIGWRRYFNNPRTMKYSRSEFDYYPKGTGFFFAPRDILLDAMKWFENNTSDVAHSSDDTLLIRRINEDHDISLSPHFSCTYNARSTFSGFIKHAYHRGEFFVDGFLRKGTRFFYPLLGILMLSVAMLIAALIKPLAALGIAILIVPVFALTLFVGSILLGVKPKDAISLGCLGVPFTFVYLVGIWRGVIRRLRLKEMTTKHRAPLGGSILEYLVVAAIYAAITVVLTGYTLLNIHTQVFTGGSGDATAGFLWLNYVDPGLNPILESTNMVNYPYGQDLGGPTFITYSAIWMPLRLLSYLFGPVAGLNLMVFSGFMLAAMSGYWMLKRLTGSKMISFFAGYAIAFVPYNIYKSASHLAYLYCVPFILMIAAFYATWIRPNVLRAMLLALAIAAAFYTDGYYLLIASVTIISLLAAAILYGIYKRYSGRMWMSRLRAGLVAILTLAVLAAPIMYIQFSQGSQINQTLSSSRPSDPESEIRAYRSRVEDFLLPSREHPVLSQDAGFASVAAYKETRSTPSESMNYMGWTIILLTVVGLILLLVGVFMPSRSTLRSLPPAYKVSMGFFGVVLVVSTIVFLLFMFSPGVSIKGHPIYFPGHYMAEYGIAFWRVLARFFIPMHIIWVIFASLVLAIFWRGDLVKGAGKRLRLFTVIAIMLLMMFEYATMYNRPSFDFTKLPGAYRWLRDQEDIKVIAELPIVDPLDGKSGFYATAQIVHGKKIVNFKDPTPYRLNNTIGVTTNPETINMAYYRGAQAIVTHDQSCVGDGLSWGRLVHSEGTGNSQVCVYRLDRPLDGDQLFARFDTGFDYTAVRELPYEQSIKIGSRNAKLNITDSSMSSNAQVDRAAISAEIRYISNAPIYGTWRVLQGGTVVAEGKIDSRTTRLDGITVNPKHPVYIDIDYAGVSVKDIDTYLYNTKVYSP